MKIEHTAVNIILAKFLSICNCSYTHRLHPAIGIDLKRCVVCFLVEGVNFFVAYLQRIANTVSLAIYAQMV